MLENFSKFPEPVPPPYHPIPAPPKPKFTLQEEFIETTRRVNEALERVLSMEHHIKHHFENLASSLTADNTAFKDICITTYNQFSEAVKNEVNSFESSITNSYTAFTESVKADYSNFDRKYTEFETEVNGIINTFKEDMNGVYNDFRSTVLSQMEDYNENHETAFNNYVTEVNKIIANAEKASAEQFNAFTSIINNDIADFKTEVNAKVSGQDYKIETAESYMKTNLKATITNLINEMNLNGEFDELLASGLYRSKVGFDDLNRALTNYTTVDKTTAIETRLDLLVAGNESGDTATEVTDIRVGADGETYPTAGAAVRGQLDKKANKNEVNTFMGIDLISRRLEMVHNFYPHGDFECGNYDRKNWYYACTDSFNLSAGDYYLIIPKMITPIMGNVCLEYVGGESDSSLRILRLENYLNSGDINGVAYTFKAFNVPTAGDIQIRMQVSTDTLDEGNTYGLYGVAIVDCEMFDTYGGAIPKEFTHDYSNKLDKAIGTNLFNKNDSDIIYGKFLAEDGNLLNHDTLLTTGYIPVEPSQTYIASGYQIIGAYACFYNKYKGFICSIQGSSMNPTNTIVTPENCCYVRWCVDSDKIDVFQLEKGDTATPYKPYTEFAPIENVEKRVEMVEKSLVPRGTIKAVVYPYLPLTLNNATELYKLPLENLDIKTDGVYIVSGYFTSDNGENALEIAHGKETYGGYAVQFNNSYYFVRGYINETITHVNSKPTNIKCTTNTPFTMVVKIFDNKLTVTFSDGENIFTGEEVEISGGNGAISVRSSSSNFVADYFSYIPLAVNNDTWIIGDSYLGVTNTARQGYWLKQFGAKCCYIGFAGAGSSDGYNAFNDLLKIGCPKRLIWLDGMNNADTNGAINTTWKTATENIIALCNDKNIELILATIPNVPDREHTYKNEYVRGSGYRYIDLENAVTNGGEWLTGLLSGDNVHPTEAGALRLATEIITTVPEITS